MSHEEKRDALKAAIRASRLGVRTGIRGGNPTTDPPFVKREGPGDPSGGGSTGPGTDPT